MHQCRAGGCCLMKRMATLCTAKVQSSVVTEEYRKKGGERILLKVVSKLLWRAWSLYCYCQKSLSDTGQDSSNQAFHSRSPISCMFLTCSRAWPETWGLPCSMCWSLTNAAEVRGSCTFSMLPGVTYSERDWRLGSQISRYFQPWIAVSRSPSVKWGQ